ncbi:hypothetical protein Baya_6402 [Bagarius yarrelli]|uniref:Specifically androgen-regulated gene protein n=1 Tax=Bagarius yarrelli TaxID=175774 RepID=A0A556U068_BAGYA|nr:hypothetical protein Baya_6402 [Bagarius yarrelli]
MSPLLTYDARYPLDFPSDARFSPHDARFPPSIRFSPLLTLSDALDSPSYPQMTLDSPLPPRLDFPLTLSDARFSPLTHTDARFSSTLLPSLTLDSPSRCSLLPSVTLDSPLPSDARFSLLPSVTLPLTLKLIDLIGTSESHACTEIPRYHTIPNKMLFQTDNTDFTPVTRPHRELKVKPPNNNMISSRCVNFSSRGIHELLLFPPMMSVPTPFSCIDSINSMEHLSAEERACLTFLEETIESLEAEDDNGILADGPDHQSRNKMMNKMAHLSAVSQVTSQGLLVHDDPNKSLQKDRKSNKLLVPTPLVLANGNAKLLKKKDFSPTEQKPPALVNTPKTAALNPYQPSAFLTEGTAVSPLVPERPNSNVYLSSEVIESPPSFIPEPPVRHNTSRAALAKNHPPKSSLDLGSDQKPKSLSSDLPLVLLPPPSDFMDEPMPLPPVHSLPGGQNKPQISQPASQFPSQPCPSEKTPITSPPGFDGHIRTNNPLTSMSTSPRGQLSPNDLDKLRKKASMKKAPEMVPVVPVKSAHNVSPQTNSSTFGPDYSAATGVEYEEAKSPPSVAPKPKKLPSGIVLKTHKDSTPGHSLVSPGDRMISNQKKVHLEALKKLGLLKTAEIDKGLCPNPQNKTSPHSPSNTLPSVASITEHTTSPVRLAPKHHAVVRTQDEPDFSYLSIQPEKGERENLLPTRTPSPKPFEMKSASVERSGVGLKSLTLENASRFRSQEESVENTPVSFGHQRVCEESLKGIGVKVIPPELNKEPELRRSLPIPVPSQPKTESQKAIRSHGISVIISPQNTDGEDRRQALRRLGLGLIND